MPRVPFLILPRVIAKTSPWRWPVIEGERDSLPHPFGRMLLNKLDHLPRPRFPAFPNRKLPDVGAGVVGPVAARNRPQAIANTAVGLQVQLGPLRPRLNFEPGGWSWPRLGPVFLDY